VRWRHLWANAGHDRGVTDSPLVFLGEIHRNAAESAQQLQSAAVYSSQPPRPTCLVILACAPCVPGPTVTHGEPRTTTVRISLTVHKTPSLVTVGDRPDLLQGGTRPSYGLRATKNALAGRADLQDGRPPELLRLGSGGWGVAIPSISRRATTRQPGSRARGRMRRFRRGLPPGWRVVGLRQIDGMPPRPQRARSIRGTVARPSNVEK